MADDSARVAGGVGDVADSGTTSAMVSSRQDGDRGAVQVCIPKELPPRLHIAAAQTAIAVNPVNAPARWVLPHASRGIDWDDPASIAVVTQKYWGPASREFTVSFMEDPASDLRGRILEHMNAWGRTIGISFVQTRGTGTVRISLAHGGPPGPDGRPMWGAGFWSHVGTNVLHIPKNRPTMSLSGFSMATPESEYKRVVRHEVGHTLGFPHEHMRPALVRRIDRHKAYDYFLRCCGWSPADVDQQVLTSLDERSLMGTPADETSIMCYQLPGSITTDGQPIVGGADINESDYAFAGKIYPKPARSSEVGGHGQSEGQYASGRGYSSLDDWDASEDVLVDV